MSNTSLDNNGTNLGLFVTIAGLGDRVIYADQRATVRDLVGALGGGESSVLVVQRTGRSLLPSAALCFSDIRCGDVVEIETSIDVSTTEVTINDVTLQVLTGLRKGETIALHTGENRIGRAADNDILLVDPGVSRYHATITVDESMVSVADAESTNGVLVGETIIDAPTSLEVGDRLLVGQCWFQVSFEKLAVSDRRWDAAEAEFRPIHVTPGSRPYKPYVGERIAFPAAPSKGRLWRRAGSDGFEAAVNLFDRSIQSATGALVKEIDTEWSARLGEAPAVSEIAEAVSHDPTRLWPRAANDPLITRIGLSSLPSRITCVVPQEGDPDLRARAESVVEQYRNVEGVPVTVDITSADSVLVAGDEQRSLELAYALLGQLLAQHSPDRVRLWGLFSPDRVGHWDWLKWLPHSAGLVDDGSFLQLTADPDQYGTVVKRLLATVSQSTGIAGENGNGHLPNPNGVSESVNGSAVDDSAPELAHFNGSTGVSGSTRPDSGRSEILLIDGQAVIPNQIQSIIEAMATQSDVRVTPLVVGPCDPAHKVELPFGSRGSIVIVDNDYASLEVVGTDSLEAVLGINYEVFSLDAARSLARGMSCAVTEMKPSPMFWSADGGYESAGAGTVPSNLDGLIRGADPAILVEQWADRGNPGRLSAHIGVNQNGPVKIDLRELGPHALVSGDLEGFLPAWVCSLATNYGPSDLNFYLIDSTGGSVFRNCQDLPHTIGALHDTSVLQIKPALAMLSAEMDRREAVLSSLDCDTIEGLERQGRSSPFPYLVVAVDRVEQLGGSASRSDAAVVSLDPTTELLTLSDRGQRLGVHLLLGSESNERLQERIALRVHAGRGVGSTLTVGHAPPVMFSATVASARPEIVVKSFNVDDVAEIRRISLPAVEHDDLERLTNLIANAHQFSGDPLPSNLA